MSERLNRFIASAAGIGYLPLAPGTWAASVAAIIWFLLNKSFPVAYTWQTIVIILTTIAGIYCSGKLVTENEKDPAYIVIDEVSGMIITLMFIPPTLLNFLIGLMLFRFFDIVKPLGIKKAEQMSKGWGIMSDDILAGIYSTIILRLFIFLR
jgi:phosphatidylglycerophosphatase A